MPAAVKIERIGESKVVRSMMKSLAELTETEGETVISTTQCVAKFPVKTLLSVLRAKEGYGRLTLTFHENTGNVQIHSSAVVEDEPMEFLAELETWYVEVCLADGYMDEKVPEMDQAAISSLRLPAWSRAELRTFPCSRDALLGDMKNHYGLSFEMLMEVLEREGEIAFVDIEAIFTDTM